MPPEQDPCDSRSTVRVSQEGEEATIDGCLIFVGEASAADQGRSLRLRQGSAVIGRDEECDLIVRDASVSRKHARLTVTSEGILVEDLGSTNGITYLGKRIERATLQLGARLEVGSCKVDLLPLRGSRSLPVSTRDGYGELVGTSLPMRRLYTTLEMLEKSDAPVLIEGETGTGKELVARALHNHGLRAGGAFVTIDCGNVPFNLMESELFGHRKGSFTGAVADRAGAFEAANGGTVFLDELGELPKLLQPKLLRVLETGQVKRLGDTQYIPVDVRVVAATQCDLTLEVSAGRFREDLYYRVAVVQLQLPPLRERSEDIAPLVRQLAARVSPGEPPTIPNEAVERFMRHDWPGNVRELRNAVQRVLALGIVNLGKPARAAEKTGEMSTDAGSWSNDMAYKQARALAINDFEIDYLKRLMDRCEGNVSAAARTAGIDRKYLRDLLKKHGLYGEQ